MSSTAMAQVDCVKARSGPAGESYGCVTYHLRHPQGVRAAQFVEAQTQKAGHGYQAVSSRRNKGRACAEDGQICEFRRHATRQQIVRRLQGPQGH